MEARVPGPVFPSSAEDFLGLWSRTYVEDPIGAEQKNEVQVYWIQAPSCFVDIRIPRSRPDIELDGGFEAISELELLALSTQKGFCGKTAAAWDLNAHPSHRCTFTWLRSFDFQPFTGMPDIGLVSFLDESKTDLVEYGVIGDDYKELWHREVFPTAGICSLAFLKESSTPIDESDLPHIDTSAHRGYLVCCGSRFMYMIPRKEELSAQSSLTELVASCVQGDLAEGEKEAALNTYLNCEVSFGRIVPKHEEAIFDFQVELSTLPTQEGVTFHSTQFVALDEAHGSNDDSAVFLVQTVQPTSLKPQVSYRLWITLDHSYSTDSPFVRLFR
eukprot:GILJ01008337.1.p1 GENE.GILJ01008337.1~~GILJ01008337.1.p1  ORF type:complete len:330 (-),score=36.64 GILJ01008337.1:102-1091(-)